ncbi:hypothetical protein M9458_057622 [Cirrhinus mrigala]|uniref:Transposase n=1 Tax=Cirrhinus mrigala TaxID=683832 RepID=A0ABD0MAW0_CIRMR
MLKGYHSYPSVLPTALESEPDLSGEDDPAALLPSGRPAKPDPEMVAMLAQVAVRDGLDWKSPPCPEPSRVDDWFLRVARTGSQGPTPVTSFPLVHDELTRLWMAPFTARHRQGEGGNRDITSCRRSWLI